jgi:hypothetical protein
MTVLHRPSEPAAFIGSQENFLIDAYEEAPSEHFAQHEIQKYEQTAILVTTPIVAKCSANKHDIQEAAAIRDFRQRRIVLLGVGI